MTIVRCPRCRDEVTVPAKASGRALVRCPLCLEEYLLAEALANAPPLLVIIGGEVEQAAIDTSTAAGSEYQLSGGGIAPGAFDSTAAAAPAAMTTRPALRAMPRPRRKEKSGLILFVNYIVGGVMGLSLGLLVLWWIFRKDPLELGPKVAHYASWIVPQQFRGKPDGSADDAATIRPSKAGPNTAATESGKRSSKKATGVGASEPQDAAAELQSVPGLDEPAKPPAATLTPATEAPNSKERGAAGRSKRDDLLQRTSPGSADVGLLGTESRSTKVPMPDLKDLLPDGPFVVAPTPDNAKPLATAEEFALAVDMAVAALEKYEQVPKENGDAVRQAFIDLYNAAGEVGRVISYLDAADAGLSDSVRKMQTLFDALSGAKGTSRVRPIKFLTAQQWPEQRSGQGLLAAGTVKDWTSVGPLFAVTLEASVRDSTLTLPLVTTNNPQDLGKIGDELVVVGRVIDEPKQNLPGYEGNQPRVLLVGFAVRVPKSE